MITIIRFDISLIFVCIFGYMSIQIMNCIKNCNKIQFYSTIKTCFFMAILFVIALTIFPIELRSNNSVNYNLIPFKTILTFLSYKDTIDECVNIIGNIILFIPIGFFAYIMFKGKKLKTIVLCLAITLSIEIIQLVLPARSCNIDDIIVTFTGGYIGLILAIKFVSYINRKKLCQNK